MFESAQIDRTDLVDAFVSPGSAFRGAPFWSWNGHLTAEELLRQIRVMKEMGLGGYFMHSRTGLQTRYLGDEWFALTNACADEGERLGMHTWLYDEDRWPSGTAGGMVTEEPTHRARFLRLDTQDSAGYTPPDHVLAVFAGRLDGVVLTHCRRLNTDELPADGETVLVFRVEEAPASSFYNGNTDVDRLSRDATERFIELTHDAYRRNCGERFGQSIHGIFTDEPHRQGLMTSFGQGAAGGEWRVPWTSAVPEQFAARFGYDLIDRLPELFLQLEGKAVSQVKWHFVDLLQMLFLENFAQPVYDWCTANGLMLTGHVLHEDCLSAQVAMQGSLMRFYEFMHVPGIDVLTEGNRNYWIVKQLASAARQLGRPWLLSELYGCTGWQMSFESHKAVGDWQTLFGINLRCHHLSWYTMEGEAKRDFPGSILHQSGWWRDYDYVETYFARLGLLLSQGTPCCDVLVINPIESLWSRIRPGWCRGLAPADPEIQAIEAAYRDLFFWLAGAQIDFDYADEEMLGRMGSVGHDATPLLSVGKADYRCVVVGRMTTMRASTTELLSEFTAAGGTVIQAGEPATHVNALPSRIPAALSATRVPWERDAFLAACRPHVARAIRIEDTATGETIQDVFCQLRETGSRTILVAMNVNRESAYTDATVRIKGEGHVEEWDCRTGERWAVRARREAGSLVFSTSFSPSGERVFVIDIGKAADLPIRPALAAASSTVLTGPFEYRLNEPNVCVLDRARFRLGDGQWQDEAEILKVDRAVREAFGLPHRSGEMIQPWFREAFHDAPAPCGTLVLEFGFDVEVLPAGPVHLCAEHPELFDIRVNDVPLIPPDDTDWWMDVAFRKLPFPASLLREGHNIVTLVTEFHEGVDLEALYLIGEFGVRLDGPARTLTPLPDQLAAGDVVTQGLPFYSGTVTYRIPTGTGLGSGETAELHVPDFEAACVKVRSESMSERMIAWHPYSADVTQAVAAGENLLVDVVLTRRNTFGPLHLVPVRAGGYSPGSYTTGGPAWSDDYMLWPAGLLGNVALRTAIEDPLCHPATRCS